MSFLSKIKGLVTSSKHRPETSKENGRKERPKSYKERSSRKDVYVRQTSLSQEMYVREHRVRGDNLAPIRPVSGNLFLQQKTLGCFSEPDVPRGVEADRFARTGGDRVHSGVRELPLLQPFYAQRPKRFSLPNGYSLSNSQYSFTNGTHGQTPDMIPMRRRSDAMCGYVPKAVCLHDTSSILQGQDTSKQTMLLMRRGDKPSHTKPGSQSRDGSQISGNPKNSHYDQRSAKTASSAIFRTRHSLKEKPARHVTKNERRLSHDAGRQTSPFTSDDGNFYFTTAFLCDLIPNTKHQTPNTTSQNPTSARDLESNRKNPDVSNNDNNRYHRKEDDRDNDIDTENNNKLLDNASARDEFSDDTDAEVSSILQHLNKTNGNYRKQSADTGKYEDIFGSNTEPLY